MNWKDRAIKTLEESLYPVPTELNELDWKSGLSSKSERLAQHISAFANYTGGGMLVYGVHDDGTLFSMSKTDIDDTIQRIGNIAHNNLATNIQVEHAVIDYNGSSLLFIYIPEQPDRPVYLRGRNIFDSYCRSAGQTVKMSRDQVRSLIAQSDGFKFEESVALGGLTGEQILQKLDYKKFHDLLRKNTPATTEAVLDNLTKFGLCRLDNGVWNITNKGALLFANDLTDFSRLVNKAVVFRKYNGTNNRDLMTEKFFYCGYAVAFDDMVDIIMRNTSTEVIDVLRSEEPTYPRVAIREFVANALVHQDFAITGIPLAIEVFSNRLVITNAGAPLNDINRLIDLPPHSRNEDLAQTMYMLGMCERRGSGIDRAVEAVAKMWLPAVKIAKTEQTTRVTMFPRKDIREMTKEEKIDICYQHACLMYEDNMPINNQSIRERFNLGKNQSSDASRIIADTLERGLIKLSNADIISKKYATYIPYYG